MRTTIQIILLVLFLQACNHQTKNKAEIIVKFDTLISHFEKKKYLHDTIRLPIIYKGDDYSLEICSKPLKLELGQIVVKNPFGNKYPISNSVIYHDKLISLFEPGGFICLSTSTFERDTDFEDLLNTRKFQKHWILGNKLVGKSYNKYYYLNSDNTWVEYLNDVPFTKEDKLFEDNTYLAFADCHGEFGGTVYFYNKHTMLTHFTGATCANTILKIDNNYYVLSQLGHICGHTDFRKISYPDSLPIVDLKTTETTIEGLALGYTDTSNIAKPVFRYSDIQIYATFILENRIYYLVDYKGEIFIAIIENSAIKIVNPLFNEELLIHNSLSITYDKTTLINMLVYEMEVGQDREISCIIIQDGKLTLLNWNKKHKK